MEVVGVANEKEFFELVKLLTERYDGRVSVVCEGIGEPELAHMKKQLGDKVSIDIYQLHGLKTQQHVTFRPVNPMTLARPAND